MQAVEYRTEITPDGRIDLPASLLQTLVQSKRTSVRVMILFEGQDVTRRIPCLAGRWQDERSSEEIVAAIRSDRANNQRSEQATW